VRLATGDTVQALLVNDGNEREWSQGTPVQVHLPAEALRVLPPTQTGETTVEEDAVELAAVGDSREIAERHEHDARAVVDE
jgi:hypothetical protein